MSEPNCIWGDCTNKSHLFSRSNGVRVCSQKCLVLYRERRNADRESKERFQELWFLHISLWQQIFYEWVNFGEGEDLVKLMAELKYNIESISLMSTNKEVGSRLRQVLEEQEERIMRILGKKKNEIELERKKWRDGQKELLEVMGLSVEEELIGLMEEYSRYFLELMDSIVQKNPAYHCSFRLLNLIVNNLSEGILRALTDPTRARLSLEEEPKTMMMRPENGRRHQREKPLLCKIVAK